MRRTELQDPDGSDANGRAILIVSLIIVALLVLLETLSWCTARAGVFSLLSTVSFAHPGPPAQDVDKHSLRIPILLVLWVLAIGVCRLIDFRLDLPHRPAWILLVLAVAVGGLVFDDLCGKSIITEIMKARGYSRCVAGDHVKWNSKSHVGFANYRLAGEACHRNAGG